MAGWRIAFAVGNESVIETINLLQDHMYVSIFGAVQDAAREALLSSQSCVIDLVNSYESRRNALISACHFNWLECRHSNRIIFCMASCSKRIYF